MVDMISIPIRVISKNIRYATESPFKGEEPWSVRKNLVTSELRFNSLHNQSSFICCQEVLHGQLLDILAGLQQFDKWDYIGWGRTDGKEKGEYSPIFFRPAVWEVIEKNPTWLSPTPDVPSKDHGAGSIRILTRAKFRHIDTGVEAVVFCTHLDNVSSASRQRAADIICKLASKDSDFPLILAGDFNSEQNQEAYQCIIQSGLFQDVSNVVDRLKYGNLITFTGFRPKHDEPTRIDYIFHNNAPTSGGSPRFRVLDYAVLPNRFDDGTFNSDHRAVVADLLLSLT